VTTLVDKSLRRSAPDLSDKNEGALDEEQSSMSGDYAAPAERSELLGGRRDSLFLAEEEEADEALTDNEINSRLDSVLEKLDLLEDDFTFDEVDGGLISCFRASESSPRC
jgi:hypothetical protein